MSAPGSRVIRFAIFCALIAAHAAAQSILPFAGGGTDDGRPATQAAIDPWGIAVDATGNVFISTTNHQRVRMVSAANGIISTFAGIGAASYSGDGGPATAAAFFNPAGMAFDAAGNLYIADSSNSVIRKIDPSGIITTVAGIGTLGFSGDGGLATAAALSEPEAIAFDSAGNLYIADTNNNRIRKVAAGTHIISTVAGTGTAGNSGDGGPAISAALNYPVGVAIDAKGNVYVADYLNDVLRKIDPSGTITRFAGTGVLGFSGDGGPATAAQLTFAQTVAADSAGNVYIGDNSRVREVSAATGLISTVAGGGSGAAGDGGPANQATLSQIFGLAFDAHGSLYIADRGDSRVRKVTNGIITTIAGNGSSAFLGDGGPALSASLFLPFGIATDRAGNVYIADSDNNRVRKVTVADGTISTIAGGGKNDSSVDGVPATSAKLGFPADVAIDAANNIYIADAQDNRIRRVTPNGIISTIAGNGNDGFSGDGGPATAAQFNFPQAMTFDATGNLYIADSHNSRIRKIDSTSGVIRTVAGNGVRQFSGDGGPATAASLDTPQGVAVDAIGNLYIADTNNNRIRRVDALTQVITTIAGTGAYASFGDGGPASSASVAFPGLIKFDNAGNLYVPEIGGDRLRKISANGVISTIAGNGRFAYAGDGGPASASSLANPYGVAIDPKGNLYIADSFSSRVRVVPACVSVSAPSLLSPSPASAVDTAPTLSWSSVDGAFRYDVALAEGSNASVVIASDITGTTYRLSNLRPGTTYSWRILAKGDPFCSPQSTAASLIGTFTTASSCTAPGAFDLLLPVNNASGLTSTTQLSWQPAAGASTYDLFLGTSNPPPLAASNLAVASRQVQGLTASTTYNWYVVAHASCDSTKTTASAIRSFVTAGACAPAGQFSALAPADAAAGVPVSTMLDWSASPNAASYDVYLGNTTDPPLYLTDVTSPPLQLSGLTPATTYYWKIVAKAACDPSKSAASAVRRFTTATACATPAAPSLLFVPPGNVAVGQTYTITWQDLPELGSDGFYIVERSASASFSTILDSQQTFSASASFIPTTSGTYYHRVRAVAGCDPSHPGAPSQTRSVNVSSATPNVIFTVQPQAVITALGDRIEDQKTQFTIENLGNTPLSVIISKAVLNSDYEFFFWRDPLGGDPIFVQLQPRTPKTFEIQFHGPAADVAASYEGIILVNANGGPPLAITPYAFVNLKVGGGNTAKPVFENNGVPTEYAFFPGLTGDDTGRPPITINIRNTSTTPMELGAEIGPEVWLAPESGWNATPIPPGASRSVRLFTRRGQAPNGSALPRYTYFTARSKNGQTARLLVQDNDAPQTSLGRNSLLKPGSRSFILPGIVSTSTQFSRIRVTNVGSEPVQTELFFTPAGEDGFNAAAVRHATIVVPPNDVVSVTDPLAQVFGVQRPASGQIELRAAPEKIGFLLVGSSVVTPASTGGSYSFELPSLLLGEGARIGTAHEIAGVASNAVVHATLQLVETSGTELTHVRVTLFDSQGTGKGNRLIDVPRYGQVSVDNVVQSLGGTEPFDSGRIEISVESGGGTVAGLLTLVDATHNNGAVLVSQPSSGGTSTSASAALRHAKTATADVSVVAFAPVVVNDPARTGGAQRTTMGFLTTSGSALTAVVTYRPSDAPASPITKTLQLASGAIVQFGNVLEDLFGVPKGQAASGSVFISTGAGAQIYALLGTLVGGSWSISSGLPIVPTLSDALSSISSKRPLYLDGLEQSVDPTRGTKWSVTISEIAGGSGSVVVRLFEAGNRTTDIGEARYNVTPYQQLKLDTIFTALGLDTDQRRKDRTNVLCQVSAESGNAVISATAISTDNQTGDTRTFVFSPTGGVPSTGVLRITTVAPVSPEAPNARHRAVRP